MPSLRILPASSGPTRVVVLVLHGGRAHSDARVRPWQLAYRRMIPFARTVHAAAREHGTAVWLLQNRLRGWNEPTRDPLIDAREALERIRRVHPDARIALLGHSMGARAALRLGGEPGVRAVCALAPWVEADEPAEHLIGRSVLIAHGDRDRTTSPRASASYAERARELGCAARLVPVHGDGHAMLRHWRTWNRLVREFTTEATRDEGASRPDDPAEGDPR